MRLIDADVFKTEYDNLITWVSHRAEKERLREFIKDIQNQPTVKAIPIEWMKNYARKICTDDDGRYNSKAYGIDRMIYDWEKENEQIVKLMELTK